MSTPAVVEVQAWVLVDADGSWVVGKNPDELHERYVEDVGEETGTPRRVFSITLKVPVPTVVELVADVPAETAPSGLTVRAG
jgi:hypothetical protein